MKKICNKTYHDLEGDDYNYVAYIRCVSLHCVLNEMHFFYSWTNIYVFSWWCFAQCLALSMSFNFHNLCFQVIMAFCIMKWKPVSLGHYQYPEAANVVGWILAVVSIAPIPITSIYVLSTTEGSSLLEVSIRTFILFHIH